MTETRATLDLTAAQAFPASACGEGTGHMRGSVRTVAVPASIGDMHFVPKARRGAGGEFCRTARECSVVGWPLGVTAAGLGADTSMAGYAGGVSALPPERWGRSSSSERWGSRAPRPGRRA